MVVVSSFFKACVLDVPPTRDIMAQSRHGDQREVVDTPHYSLHL